jgi:CHASE3 domain sensor protein
MKVQSLYILFLSSILLCCGSAVDTPQEKTEMDKLCECFESNNAYAVELATVQDSIKREKIVTANLARLETCRVLANTLGETLNEMPEEERDKNQQSFQNSCSAYKEFIDNNN